MFKPFSFAYVLTQIGWLFILDTLGNLTVLSFAITSIHKTIIAPFRCGTSHLMRNFSGYLWNRWTNKPPFYLLVNISHLTNQVNRERLPKIQRYHQGRGGRPRRGRKGRNRHQCRCIPLKDLPSLLMIRILHWNDFPFTQLGFYAVEIRTMVYPVLLWNHGKRILTKFKSFPRPVHPLTNRRSVHESSWLIVAWRKNLGFTQSYTSHH